MPCGRAPAATAAASATTHSGKLPRFSFGGSGVATCRTPLTSSSAARSRRPRRGVAGLRGLTGYSAAESTGLLGTGEKENDGLLRGLLSSEPLEHFEHPVRPATLVRAEVTGWAGVEHA